VKPPDARHFELANRIQQEHRVERGPLLLFIGRLVEEKGVEDLLHATRLLGEQHPNIRTLVVGEGQDRVALQQTARDLAIADRVLFTGWVESEDIPAYLLAADVFVGPSRTSSSGWIEAQGLTFLEAMAAGTPIVATRLGGIVDSVTDGETGLLVAERAPEQLASAIHRLLLDSRLASRLSAAARQTVSERFSRDASAQAFSELFAEMIDAQHSTWNR
jgi:glycosyltransferase involved in cell wall biosynthesis